MTTRKQISASLMLVLTLSLLPAQPLARAQDDSSQPSASRFVSFSSFRPKFHNDTETFSLIANFYIVNAAPQTLKDVTYRQPFPPELKIKLAPDYLESQLTRPAEFWQKIEDNTYVMYEPKILRRQPASILAELALQRRMSTFTIPPTLIEFTTTEGPGKEQTLPTNIDVTEYANHVGDLDRFLRKKAGIGLDVKTTGRNEWEFAPIDAVAMGRNPEGIIGVETSDSGYTGHFRLHNGVPGDALDVLVAWKQTRKGDRLQEEKAAQDSLAEYLKWTGPFKFDPDATKVKKGKFKRYDAWLLEGRWLDTIPKRLGSGPVKAVVFYSGREDVEYTLIFQAQGRGAGPDKCDTPAPEKEQALMALQEKLLDTFRSEVVPLSYNR